MSLPVTSISKAFFLFPIFLTNATAGVWQNNPILIPGVLKVALLDATTKSQVRTS